MSNKSMKIYMEHLNDQSFIIIQHNLVDVILPVSIFLWSELSLFTIRIKYLLHVVICEPFYEEVKHLSYVFICYPTIVSGSRVVRLWLMYNIKEYLSTTCSLRHFSVQKRRTEHLSMQFRRRDEARLDERT